ncbi:DUF308 domain-containing protein [Kribbella sp. NPDC006257]|uniref:DUF308 domain-containing protein n=1 Tax=Kribbella sp. NPDC006257 TaxID=3156738 RepID=UPI0033BC8F23
MDRNWLVVIGVIAVVAAFLAIASPGLTAVTLTWILGIWLIVRGVFEVAAAFGNRPPRQVGRVRSTASAISRWKACTVGDSWPGR